MEFAWILIDSEFPLNVRTGNRELLRREQEQTIQDDYDLLANRSPLLDLLLAFGSFTGQSPMPGGRGFIEVVAPNGLADYLVGGVPSVADFDDRWEWIVADMFPAYVENVYEERPDTNDLFELPIADEVNSNRTLGELLGPYSPQPL